MWYIKEILKASVCSFCETVHYYESLEAEEFIEGVKKFLNESNLDDYLVNCTEEIAYDIENIDNICREHLYSLKRKHFNENIIRKKCLQAFSKTLYIDKTTNVEAFVDNLTESLKNRK